jgi:uncharacterized membrane protein YbhN (UPF0104 family)
MPRETNRFRLLFLLAGLVAVVFMIYKIGVDTILQNIRLTGWWFIPIIGIWIVVYLLNAFSWRIIIRDGQTPKVPFLRIFQMTVSGYAINYITPMVALGGEPYRILELRQYVGGAKASSAVILYSMMHIMSHFLFWTTAAILIIAFKHPSVPVMFVAAGIIAVCAIAICFFIKGYRNGLLVKSVRIAGKIPFIGAKIRRKSDTLQEKIRHIDSKIVELYTYRRKDFFKSLILEFISRFVSCLEVYFIVKAIGMNQFAFIDAIIAIAVTSLLANILFFAPLQMGTREGGFMLAFQGMTFVSGLGVYVSLITRIRETFWILTGVLLMYRPRNKRITPIIQT